MTGVRVVTSSHIFAKTLQTSVAVVKAGRCETLSVKTGSESAVRSAVGAECEYGGGVACRDPDEKFS